MTDNEKTNPELIKPAVSSFLRDYSKNTLQIETCMIPKQERQVSVIEGGRMYLTGVRAVYDLLCLIDTKGEKVDARQVRAIKEGMAEYLASMES